MAWFKNKLYGRSTEQLSDAERQQLRLFDEIESSVEDEPEEEQPAEDHATTEAAKPRRRAKRKPLPQWLPRVERLIDLAEQDKQCACGHSLVRIGEDSAERVDVTPPQIQVIRIVRPKYACHHCEGSGDEDRPAVRVAPAPPAAEQTIARIDAVWKVFWLPTQASRTKPWPRPKAPPRAENWPSGARSWL